MRKSRVVTLWILAGVLFAAASTSTAGSLITTYPFWDGSSFINSFGVPNTETYGQVITVPALETSLTSFRFTVDDLGTPMTFLAEVYQWDPVNSFTIGPNLFESAPITTPGAAGYQNYTINIPGGAPVVPGQQYVIFLTTSKSAQTNSASHWGWMDSEQYNGGDFVFQNNGNNFASLSTNPWNTFTNTDLAFAAAFGGATITAANPVPALSGSMLLLLAGSLALIGLVVLRLRAA